MNFDNAFITLPLVAIARGLEPARAATTADILVEAGFTIIEVPLNSPEPLRSIETIARRLDGRAVVGAGTVLTEQVVADVAGAGGTLIVMPHADTAVIGAAKRASMTCCPGVATPTEAFAALAAGADALKLFPAELVTPPVLKAMRAVLPSATRLLPVGGITPTTMGPYLAAGASGFGLGSALFTPTMSDDTLASNAKAFVAAWQAR